MNENLKYRVFTGVVWNGVARIGQQVMQFGLSVILARLLLPEDFGTIAMVLVFVGFANIFVDAGFSAALIQRAELENRHIYSTFWVSIVIGAGMTFIFFMSAPVLAAFYKNSQLLNLTQVFSFTFIISTIGMVPFALLQRRLQFHLLARFSLIATLLSGLLGIFLAFNKWGVWSLVAQSLISNLLLTGMYWWGANWKPQLVFESQAVRELWKFTANLFGFNFINYWARNADNLVIGRAFGAVDLGNYNRAYALMLLPITQIISVISTVMFPALSSIQTDCLRIKRIYLRAMGLISLLTFPMMTGLLVVAEPFVLTLYGDKWIGVIPIIRILALVGIVQSLTNPTGWIYLSQGRTDWMLWWGIGGAGTLIASIFLGASFGSVNAVALCYAAANLLLLYPAIAIPGRLIDLQFRMAAKAVSGPFFGSVLMGTVVWLINYLIPQFWSPWQKLALLTFSGLIIYGLFVKFTNIEPWQDFCNLLSERLPSFRQRLSEN